MKTLIGVSIIAVLLIQPGHAMSSHHNVGFNHLYSRCIVMDKDVHRCREKVAEHAPEVPVPAALWLFASALGLFVASGRRK